MLVNLDLKQHQFAETAFNEDLWTLFVHMSERDTMLRSIIRPYFRRLSLPCLQEVKLGVVIERSLDPNFQSSISRFLKMVTILVKHFKGKLEYAQGMP